MNTPNPLVPQGSLQSKGKSTVRIAFFTILGLHVVFIGGLLFVGCSKDTPPAPVEEPVPVAVDQTNLPPLDTNLPPATPDTNIATAPVNAYSAPVPVTPLPPPVPVVVAPSGNEYTVAGGDILGSIAHKHGVTLKALLEANPGVDPKKLKIGQKLQIPAPTAPTVAAVTTGAPVEAAALAESTTYIVKSGDMLEKIARTHGTSTKAIVALNGLKSANSLKVGQKLKMPAPKSAAVVPPVSAAPVAAPMAAPVPMTTTN